MKFQWICKLEGGHVPTCPLPGDATVNEHMNLKLFGREIIFEEFQPV